MIKFLLVFSFIIYIYSSGAINGVLNNIIPKADTAIRNYGQTVMAPLSNSAIGQAIANSPDGLTGAASIAGLGSDIFDLCFFGKSSNINIAVDGSSLPNQDYQLLVQANTNKKIEKLEFIISVAPVTSLTQNFNLQYALVLIRNQHLDDPNYYNLNSQVYNPQSFDENNDIYKSAINNVILYKNLIINPYTFWNEEKVYKYTYPMPITMKTNDVLVLLWQAYPSSNLKFNLVPLKTVHLFINKFNCKRKRNKRDKRIKQDNCKNKKIKKSITPICYMTGHISFIEQYTKSDFIDENNNKIYAA